MPTISQPRLRTAISLLLAVVALVLLSALPARAELRLELRRPYEPEAIFGNAWTIFASGQISEGDAGRLRRLVDANAIPEASFVYLDSPGGSLLEGLKLGKVIRDTGLYTYVGRRKGSEVLGAPGECLSACSLAFLGGRFRWIVAGSTYGVHRFYAAQKSPLDGDIAQMMSSVIVSYLQEMGVDPRLFSEMSFTGSDAINVMSPARMRELNVINEGRGPTAWTLESNGDGVYLKGERDTFRGINKFMIICTPTKELALYTVFDAQNRDRELMQMKAISMFADDKVIPLSGHLIRSPEIVNGWMNAFFGIDAPLLRQIRNSRTVGVAFQYANGAPSFLGFNGFSMEGSGEKLEGLLRVCRR